MALPTHQTLVDIIANREAENLILEFKRSESLAKNDSAKNEISKDVSAMANSAGGRIIYGIEEIDHVPQRLDQGSDDAVLDREWIEQVINSRIQPRIDGLIITPIVASSGRTYYVLDVPQATSRAPHQAHDKRYYKRFNFMAVAMEDYEVKDALRRNTTPVLEVLFSFRNNESSSTISFPNSHENRSESINLHPILKNHSMQTAQHVIVEVYFQPQIELSWTNAYAESLRQLDYPVPRLVRIKQFLLTSPPAMPIFKEADMPLSIIAFTVPRIAVSSGPQASFPFGYRIRCPGYDLEKWGLLKVVDNVLTIELD